MGLIVNHYHILYGYNWNILILNYRCFYCHFYKRIGGPCKNEVLLGMRTRLCGEESNFVFICDMHVCYHISCIYDTSIYN